MAKRPIYVHPAARDAAKILGQQIRMARQVRGMTVKELAERVGVSPRTITSLESGASGTAIGTVFTVAVFVGVPLFGIEDREELARIRLRGEERLALLPKRVAHRRESSEDDDF